MNHEILFPTGAAITGGHKPTGVPHKGQQCAWSAKIHNSRTSQEEPQAYQYEGQAVVAVLCLHRWIPPGTVSFNYFKDQTFA